MKLKLQTLFSGKTENENGEISLDFASRDFGAFQVLEPARLGFSAKAQNGAVLLDITLDATVQAVCARCAAPFERPWQWQNSFRITSRDLEEEFPELPFTADGGLDLEELAYGELLMEVGPVLLCREDCEGLCQNCGQPQGSCKCEPEQAGDPRLQVLKQLLQAEEDSKP